MLRLEEGRGRGQGKDSEEPKKAEMHALGTLWKDMQWDACFFPAGTICIQGCDLQGG